MAAASTRRTGGKSVGTDTKLAAQVAGMQAQFDTIIERMGERIELAIERALKNYTHRDDHTGLADRVQAIEEWRTAQTAAVAAQSAATAVEIKHADRRQASVDEWLRTLFPYAVMAFGLVMAFKGGF